MTKTKTLSFAIASVLAIFLFASFASALTVSDATIDWKTGQGQIVVTAGAENLTNIALTDTGSFDLTYDTTSFSLNTGQSKTVNISIVDKSVISLGKTYTATMTATSGNTSASGKVSATRLYCDTCSNVGNLAVSIDDVTVNSGFGDDESFWYLNDEVSVDIKVENKGDWDMQDLEVSIALYTTDGKKIFEDKKIKKVSIDSDDEQTVTYTFTLNENIEDFKDQKGVLYVKAQGKIDDSDSAYDNNATCDEDKLQVDVRTGDDFVIVTNYIINGVETVKELNDSLNCGSKVTMQIEVTNIGDAKQEETYLTIYNKELGIDKTVEIGDIKAFDTETVNFEFTLPKDTAEKWYELEFEVYDDSDDIFVNSEDDQSISKLLIKVDGGCQISDPIISAKLDSEARAGKELIVKTTNTNTEDKQVSFLVSASGFNSWSTLKEVSEGTFVLEAGQSKDVNLVFDVQKEIEGTQSFTIDVLADNEFAIKQSVAVEIESSKFNLFDFLKSNWLLVALGALIVILVVVIIIVAVRARR
ncbi:MAG: putative S-layer protein [archaeon]|jgi:hypothetical protein